MSGRALTVAAALVVAGCGYATAGQDPGGGPWGSRDVPDSVHLIVTNHNFADVRLVAIQDGRRFGLGTVTGKSDGRFTVPWAFHHELQIELNLLPGPVCLTDVLQVDPGDILDLEISPVLFERANCR